MKIALLIDSLHSVAAGSERQIFKLAEGLTQAGHQVHLYLLRHTQFTRTLTDFPCPISSLDIGRIASLSALKCMAALRKQLVAEGVSVVHAYFPDACLLAPLSLKCPQIRIITSRRDMGLIYQGKPAWLYSLLKGRTDKIVANSQAVADHVSACEQLPAGKTAVIYNGIEDFDFASSTAEPIYKHPDSIKVILVANIKPVKRTLDAVMAVHMLKAARYPIELVLAGEPQDTTYVEQIKDYIEAHKLTDNVHWLGQVAEPRRLLSQAHIGLLVSESEGLSNTIMEYMQAGLPVIATNVGGNPELVRHEQNGLLIERGQVQQLADAIFTLSNQPDLICRYGENGKERIQREFSLRALVVQHEALYLA